MLSGPDGNTYHANGGLNIKGKADTAHILQSVKEQEAQFEQLSREIEAERECVANQLERCKLGSETASLTSAGSADDSFQWRPPHLDESDTHNKSSQLVDSCFF